MSDCLVSLSVRPSVFKSARLSIQPPVTLHTFLPAYLPASQPACLPAYLPVYQTSLGEKFCKHVVRFFIIWNLIQYKL
jgi:hypothetical protein